MAIRGFSVLPPIINVTGTSINIRNTNYKVESAMPTKKAAFKIQYFGNPIHRPFLFNFAISTFSLFMDKKELISLIELRILHSLSSIPDSFSCNKLGNIIVLKALTIKDIPGKYLPKYPYTHIAPCKDSRVF